MAVTSGFFPSLNHDRQYDNMDMGRMFDGVIQDGIFSEVGEAFLVEVSSGMDVVVKTGRAWLDHTWTLNDTNIIVTIPSNASSSTKYTFICIKVDTRSEVRENSIVCSNELSSSETYSTSTFFPNTPTGVYYHPIARIKVNSLATEIVAGDITMWIGDGETRTPYVKAAVDNVDINVLMAQYNQKYLDWWANLNTDMSTDVASGLQTEISGLQRDLGAETLARETADTETRNNLSTLFKLVKYSKAYSVTKNTRLVVPINFTVPAGYKYAGVVEYDSGAADCHMIALYKQDSGNVISFVFKNISGSTVAKTATCTLLFIRDFL
ncbi:MAG: hypothetical protein J6U54_05470 [Clostridiales bacterium]|nr:hypothetical protein [Clostridiales bacterium]